MTSSKLCYDREVGVGEYVRIWQNDNGNLFEHVFPTGRSISILCGSLDDAQRLLARSIKDGGDLGPGQLDGLLEREGRS